MQNSEVIQLLYLVDYDVRGFYLTCIYESGYEYKEIRRSPHSHYFLVIIVIMVGYFFGYVEVGRCTFRSYTCIQGTVQL